MNNLENYKENISTILDCMGGADGGASFARMKVFLEGTAESLDDGTNVQPESSKELLLIVERMAKLIKHFEL